MTVPTTILGSFVANHTCLESKPLVSTSAPNEPPQKTVCTPRAIRILCVDDCAPNLKSVERMLSRLPSKPTVVTAEGGQEALELLVTATEHGKPFDLVIMDINMPNMNGWETTEAIRNYEKEKRVALAVFIACASSEGEERTADFKERGMTHRIHKPFVLAELQEIANGVRKQLGTM